MAVTISPGWGNAEWASGRLDEDKNVSGFSKFASRRRFDWDTPPSLDDKKLTTYNPSGVYSEDGFFDGSDPDSQTRSDYTDAATERVAQSFYGTLGDYGKNVGLGTASMYGMAKALGANNVGIGDAFGAAARPSIGSMVSLPANMLSAAFGLDNDTGWTGKAYDVATAALGLALKSNPITAALSVAAPLAKNLLGDVTDSRPREKIRDYAEDQVGWGRAQGAYSDATAGINAGLNRANHMQNTFTDAVDSGKWSKMSPAEQNLMSSFVNDEYNTPYSDALAGQIEASSIAALDDARLQPEDVPALTDEYFGTALDAATAQGGWSGNKHSVNNPGTAAARAMASQMGNNVTPGNIASVNAAAMGVGNLGDLSEHVRSLAVQGAINKAMAAGLNSGNGYGGRGGNFDSSGNRTGSITGSGGIGAALGRISDALGDNSGMGGNSGRGGKDSAGNTAGDKSSGVGHGGFGDRGGSGIGGSGGLGGGARGD